MSTDDQVNGTSLDVQVDRCRSAAADNAWEIAGEFVDEGVSGALSSRPQLDALVRLVEDESIDVVIITKLDRIARSLRHLLDVLDLFDRRGVMLKALDDPLDPSTASGRAMVHLRGVFAELERELIRERTTEGLRRRVEGGGWPGGPAPYGYKITTAPSGIGSVLVIDEAEAAIIKIAYNLIALDGFTTNEAATELRRLGAKPRRSPEWTYHNLRRQLLDARGLSGQWPWRRAGRDGRTDEDEIMVSIPPILDPLQHEQLLAALSLTTTQPSKHQRYLLRGRVTSPHGVRMQGIPGHSGSRWYRCPYRPSSRPSHVDKCQCGRLHAPTVDEAVWNEVVTLLGNPAMLDQLAAEHEATRDNHASRERDRLAELDREITRTQSEMADEYAALIDDGFDPGAARAMMHKRNDQVLKLRAEQTMLTRLRGKNLAAAGLTARLRSLAQEAQSTLDAADDTLRARIIELLDLRVEVRAWEPCNMCNAKGLLPSPATPTSTQPRKPIVCPDCLRTRQIPILHLSGQVPELLLSALADGADITTLGTEAGGLVPFTTDVRVA